MQVILDKIREAPLCEHPFKHYLIEDFLPPDLLSQVLGDDNIHFQKAYHTKDLMGRLRARKWEPVNFPGCVRSEAEYLKLQSLSSFADEGNPVESSGMAYRLLKYSQPYLQELMEFLNSEAFGDALREKLEIGTPTITFTRVQKYLSGYEISPHPDIRAKAATYLLNINKPGLEVLPIHTHLLRLKTPNAAIYDKWWETPDIDRCWVPWDWCETVKTTPLNNSLVLFRVSDFSLHGIKANYRHLSQQRTQIYGNLMYKHPPRTTTENYRGLAVRIPDLKKYL